MARKRHSKAGKSRKRYSRAHKSRKRRSRAGKTRKKRSKARKTRRGGQSAYQAMIQRLARLHMQGGGKSKFLSALQRLGKMPKHQRSQAISMANDKFIRQVCTYVKSLRHARVSPKVARGLKRHAKKLRHLVKPKLSIASKRKFLSQRGGGLFGFLAHLIRGVVDAVSNI